MRCQGDFRQILQLSIFCSFCKSIVTLCVGITVFTALRSGITALRLLRQGDFCLCVCVCVCLCAASGCEASRCAAFDMVGLCSKCPMTRMTQEISRVFSTEPRGAVGPKHSPMDKLPRSSPPGTSATYHVALQYVLDKLIMLVFRFT